MPQQTRFLYDFLANHLKFVFFFLVFSTFVLLFMAQTLLLLGQPASHLGGISPALSYILVTRDRFQDLNDSSCSFSSRILWNLSCHHFHLNCIDQTIEYIKQTCELDHYCKCSSCKLHARLFACFADTSQQSSFFLLLQLQGVYQLINLFVMSWVYNTSVSFVFFRELIIKFVFLKAFNCATQMFNQVQIVAKFAIIQHLF